MRMGEIDQLLRRAICQSDYLLHHKIAKNAVMRFAAVLVCKQTEEQEYIAFPHSLIGEMSLRRAALPEGASAIPQKHRVVMTQIIRAKFTLARFRGMLA